MREIKAPDTISGKEGRAYAKINGSNEELFFAKKVQAEIEKKKAQINAIGKRMTGHKTVSMSGSGSMSIYYVSSLFRDMVVQWKRTGKDVYFDLLVENDDQESGAGKQAVLLMGCSLDSVTLCKLDGEGDEPLDEEISFTFEDFDILKPFGAI